MNLFDSRKTIDEATDTVARWLANPADVPWSDPDPLVQAVRTLLHDHRRLIGIAGLARQVRAAQRRYFASRTTENLEASKALERRLDAALKE